MRTMRDTLHVALTLVNRTSSDVWVRLWGGGPAVELEPGARPCTLVEREVQPSSHDGASRVFIGGEVVVLLRVAASATATLRRAIAVRDLAVCGAGKYTVTASTVVRLDVPRPERRLVAKVPLAVVP